MIKKLFQGLLIGILLTGSVFAVTVPPVSHGDILPGPETSHLQIEGGEVGGNAGFGQRYISDLLIPKVVSGFLILMLMIGVIMLIIAGINYILCAGDSEKIKQAKDTIYWALLAIIIAIMGYGIVKFVIGINLGGL